MTLFPVTLCTAVSVEVIAGDSQRERGREGEERERGEREGERGEREGGGGDLILKIAIATARRGPI